MRREITARLAKSSAVRHALYLFREQVHANRRPALIFVLGSQRSGMNVLRRSISLDPWVQGFNERKNGTFYVGWALRPEHEIRELLSGFRHTVLLKPTQSVIRRPVHDFLEEFDDYDHKTVWIYRDPVAVYRSRMQRWSSAPEVAAFVEEWNRINTSALLARDGRVAVVSYDQLTSDDKVFHTLTTWLGVRGENLFRAPSSPEPTLSDNDVDAIRTGTVDVLERLHDAAAEFLDTNATSAACDD